MDLETFAKEYKAIVGDYYDDPVRTPEKYKEVQEEYLMTLEEMDLRYMQDMEDLEDANYIEPVNYSAMVDDIEDDKAYLQDEYVRHSFHEHRISKKKTRSLMDKEREKKKKSFTRDSVRSHNWDD